MGAVLLFIVYLKQTGEITPIICQDVIIHPHIKGFLVLQGVQYADDRIAPSLKVKEIAVREKDLSHYVRGIPIKKGET